MITRESFRAHAEPMSVTVNGQKMLADVKEFKTGSVGWYAGGKVRVTIGGEAVTVQVGINLTVVGSKELPQSQAA